MFQALKKYKLFQKIKEIYRQISSLHYLFNMMTNPLKPKIILIQFKHSFHTSKETQPIIITNINLLTLFREIIAVYSENRMTMANTVFQQNAELYIVKKTIYKVIIRL
jgi:hypothetical protein